MSEAKRVLVAEDNVVLGDVIRFNLQRSGFQVTLARNGIEALRVVESQPFDILVTDYEMPGMDGEELCRRVRNELNLTAIRIVMCSAKGLELDRDEIKTRLNIEDILFKPFSIRELTTMLESLVCHGGSRREQLV
jgi:CheY-like chemotaxis protein